MAPGEDLLVALATEHGDDLVHPRLVRVAWPAPATCPGTTTRLHIPHTGRPTSPSSAGPPSSATLHSSVASGPLHALVLLILLVRLTHVHGDIVVLGDGPFEVESEPDVIAVGRKLPEQRDPLLVGRDTDLQRWEALFRARAGECGEMGLTVTVSPWPTFMMLAGSSFLMVDLNTAKSFEFHMLAGAIRGFAAIENSSSVVK